MGYDGGVSEHLRSGWAAAAGDRPQYLFLPTGSGEALEALRSHVRAHPGVSVAKEAMASSRQLLNEVIAHKGFSVHDYVGDVPKTGYMVSVDGMEETFPLQEIEAEPSILSAYRADNEKLIEMPGYYFGAWLNKGVVYLDVSVHTDDLKKAMELMKANHQLAIYDLGAGSIISTTAGRRHFSKSLRGIALEDQVLALYRDSTERA